MKTKFFFTALLVFLFGSLIQAQDTTDNKMQTLFKPSGNKIDHGGYGAFTLGYTSISGNSVLLVGGRAGWLIDHHVTLGLGGYGMTSSIYVDKVWNDQGYYLVGGYGGFFIEPIIAPNFPVHVSFPILIGAGGIAYNEYQWSDYPNHDNIYYEPFDADAFFVLEPGVEIELNVVKFFRIAFGCTYRYTDDINMINTPKNLMRGFNGNVTFKFGKF